MTVPQGTMYEHLLHQTYSREELSELHTDTTALQVLLYYLFIYLFIVGFEGAFNSSNEDLHINEYRCD